LHNKLAGWGISGGISYRYPTLEKVTSDMTKEETDIPSRTTSMFSVEA
jgi:hypothetical protein